MIRRVILIGVLAILYGVSMPYFAVADSHRENPVVAIVNGEEIRRSEVEEARFQLPQQLQSMPVEMIFPLVVGSLIDSKLAAAEARRQGLDKEKIVKDQMARIEEKVLERFLLSRVIGNKVTEAALKERYEVLVRETEIKGQVRARHILLENEADAKAVIKELQGGADFAQLAEKKSTGPSASSGGDLGYFSDGEMVAEFSQAAFGLETGQFTETPVKTQFGWHVIKVEDRRTTQPPTYEEAAPRLQASLSREIGSAYIENLRKGAVITRFNLDGSPQKEKKEGQKEEKKEDGKAPEAN